MKKMFLVTLVLAAVLVLTGCLNNSLSTTIIEFDHTGIDAISGTMRLTIEARNDRVVTWEEITHYNLEEYLAFYHYEDADAVRAWFAGPGPRLSVFPGMTFELLDITDTHVITRMFYDYGVISNEDRAAILGEVADYISLSQSVELNIAAGGRVVEE